MTNQIILVLALLSPVIITIVQSPWFKGVFGEFKINLFLLFFLSKQHYHLIKNVTLPAENGTTQIDHILVSKFGIFVIETKNMKGWIFGSPDQKQWTQKIYKYSNTFQNPIHQNYKHIKTLESHLNIHQNYLFSVIVFVGDSTFKTEMPANVTHTFDCIRYIKSKKAILFTDEQVTEIILAIANVRLERSFKTNKEHIAHVKEIVKLKKDVQICPECGSAMILRTARQGQQRGNKFWGCSSFPKCKTTVNIA